jgi:hypothetical protein
VNGRCCSGTCNVRLKDSGCAEVVIRARPCALEASEVKLDSVDVVGKKARFTGRKATVRPHCAFVRFQAVVLLRVLMKVVCCCKDCW